LYCQAAICHQFVCALGHLDLRSVETTAASKDNCFVTAGHAPASTKKTAQLASVVTPNAVRESPAQRCAFTNPWNRSHGCRMLIVAMSDVTRILQQIESGDPAAAEQLLPLVYDELRKLAAAKLTQEKSGQTLQATALVHDAYIRLVDVEKAQDWDSRGHFFAAAAEAMRRILVENARRKARVKHGGGMHQVELGDADIAITTNDERVLAIDEALNKLALEDPPAAQLVKLRYFAGFSISTAADVLGVSRTSAYEQWAYARAWLRCEVEDWD
jgi:RNA polymerase sigma factor (TIGR02999 family)